MRGQAPTVRGPEKTNKTGLLRRADALKNEAPPLPEWKDLAGFVMVETVRTVNGVDGKPERRCFITSLKADAKAFRKLVRRHWGIENWLHWVLDVVFLEDQCRARTGHAPENCSTLFPVRLLPSKISRRSAGMRGNMI